MDVDSDEDIDDIDDSDIDFYNDDDDISSDIDMKDNPEKLHSLFNKIDIEKSEDNKKNDSFHINLESSRTFRGTHHIEEQEQLGKDIEVEFHISDQKTLKNKTIRAFFKQGQTVEALCSMIEKKFGFTNGQYELLCNNTIMPLPLSLVDFPLLDNILVVKLNFSSSNYPTIQDNSSINTSMDIETVESVKTIDNVIKKNVTPPKESKSKSSSNISSSLSTSKTPIKIPTKTSKSLPVKSPSKTPTSSKSTNKISTTTPLSKAKPTSNKPIASTSTTTPKKKFPSNISSQKSSTISPAVKSNTKIKKNIEKTTVTAKTKIIKK